MEGIIDRLPRTDDSLSAAKDCPESAAVLKKLFPKVFEEPEPVSDFNVGDIVKHEEYGMGVVKKPEDTGTIGVEWFEPRPHFHSMNNFAHKMHGWWVNTGDLLLVYRPKECC